MLHVLKINVLGVLYISLQRIEPDFKMMKIFAFKEEEFKEITQDANFSLPNKNPESAIKKRIPDPDSKIGGFWIRIVNPSF